MHSLLQSVFLLMGLGAIAEMHRAWGHFLRAYREGQDARDTWEALGVEDDEDC